jgi:hypothetical protein
MSAPVAEVGGYKNITETGAVSTGPCQLIGFYVNSTNGGTLVLKDGGSGGTVMSGTITPAVGFHRFPANVGSSLHATIAGTALNVTFFFASGN